MIVARWILPPRLRNLQCRSIGTVLRVANICRQLRLVWGQEVDVEFAFVTNENEPYVLQCRPTTNTIDVSEPIGGDNLPAGRTSGSPAPMVSSKVRL
jgi:hypothetical protein